MNIIKATESEAELILDIFKECTKYLQREGITQWNENYPSITTILRDITSNSVYVLKENNNYYGVFTLSKRPEPEFDDINWRTKEKESLFVYRLAISPLLRGQGYGKKMMDFAEKLALEDGYISIRLCANTGNQKTINFYKYIGYKKVGQIYFDGHAEPYDCMEKLLNNK